MFDTVASVSPDVPADLRQLAGQGNGWIIFAYGYIAGLILCLGMTWALTVASATWIGTDANTVYFSTDRWNLALYTFVCPAYVGLCSCMIVLFIRQSTIVGKLADDLGGLRRSLWTARFPVALIAITCVTAIIVWKYIRDILDLKNVPQGYWFMTKPIDGVRYLNDVGIYYVVLNFCLLLITVTAALCFFSMFFETVRVGEGLRTLGSDSTIDFGTIKERLTSFTESYLLAKLLCGVYILNIWIWGFSPLGRTTNIDVASIALAVMGLFFISFPRYYVELMWRDYEVKSGRKKKPAEPQDIRSAKERLSVNVVDSLLISTFVLNYFGLKELGITSLLEDILKLLGVMS